MQRTFAQRAVYDLLRGRADGLLFSTWYRPQLEADAFLLGGTVPTVWLQEQLWHGSSDEVPVSIQPAPAPSTTTATAAMSSTLVRRRTS